MAKEKKVASLETLPLNVYQKLAEHLEVNDLAALAQLCRSTRESIPKIPQYSGAKARAEFFVKVGKQRELLLQHARTQGYYLNALITGTDEEKVQRYKELLRISQGDFSFQSQSQAINALKSKMQHENCNLLPLLAALKLEIIKTKPAESEYFLNINNEQTKFDYQEGYGSIIFFSVVGVVALIIAAAPLVGSLAFSSVVLGNVLPYIIAAAVAGVASLSYAGTLGDQHQRGLHEFVLDESFLSPTRVHLSK